MNALDWGILIAYALVNLVAFALMGLDKRRARRDAWRVREKTLLLWCACFGALGGLTGMRVFRHKTRHWYFVWGMPLILLLQLGLGIWLWHTYFSL